MILLRSVYESFKTFSVEKRYSYYESRRSLSAIRDDFCESENNVESCRLCLSTVNKGCK